MISRTTFCFALTASATLAFVACGEGSSTSSSGQPPECGVAGCGEGEDDASTTTDSGGVDATADAPITYPHPLDGTTKTAALVRGGLSFSEGPVWIAGKLLFTEIPQNNIRELLPDGGTPVFRNNSGGSNGLAVDPQGNLVACEGGNKRVVRSLPQGNATRDPIATTYMAAAFNSPNDVIVRADGNIYFTDPFYSGTETQNDEAVYRIASGGGVTRLAHDFTRPNGIALSPDGNTLYVVDNGAGTLLSAPVMTDGTVGAFTAMAGVGVPGGDGMAVDLAGNLYVTDNAGVDVFTKTGAKLGTVAVPGAKASNCTFGGADKKTLYITANNGNANAATGLYEMKLNVPGLP